MELSEEKKKLVDDIEPIIVEYFNLECQFDLYAPRIDQKTSTARFYLWHFLHFYKSFSIRELSMQYGRTRRNVYYGVSKTKYRVDKISCYKELYSGLIERITEKGITV